MKKFFTLFTLSLLLTSYQTLFGLTPPVITSPANNATNIPTYATITFTSSSTGNSSSSPDNMLIEISKASNFSSSQGSPDYQRFFWFQKISNSLTTYTWNVPAQLSLNTVYYVRVYSTKNGYSSIISFTTKTANEAPTVTVPSNGATGIATTPTITFTSSSTGNSSSSPDNIKIELSKDAGFSTSQSSPDYQSNYWYQKTNNTSTTYSWTIPSTLSLSTTYYIRAYSQKNGYGSVISFTTKTANEIPVISSPSNGATSISVLPTITITSSSTGNSSTSPDNIKVELSKDSGFSTSQSSPDYQSYSWFVKTTDASATYNWTVTAQLSINTTYYIRAYSTKNGYSSIISFTTKTTSDAPSITAPVNGSTGNLVMPTITFNSSSTGNSSSSPDQIKIELSKSSSFSSSQGSPDYQSNYWYSKTTDASVTYNWAVPSQLSANTTYYVRAYSSKNGYSTVISFTTKTTDEAPSITYPSNATTSIPVLPTVTFSSSSTGNSTASPDNIKIELSKSSSFSSSQGSPDYQIYYWFQKTNDATVNYSWSPTQLSLNTTYYVKITSTKNGSHTTSFTTKTTSEAPSITYPASLSTSIPVLPTITISSSSTGNSSSSPDNIKVELSKSSSFASSQGSPDYQTITYYKTDDASDTYSWYVSQQLSLNTTYYVKATSTVNGASSIVSFTTKTTNEAPTISSPATLSTNIPVFPTITISSSSTGNNVSTPDNITVILSKSSSFSSSQGSPDYQSTSFSKTTDGSSSYSWTISQQLSINTTYYVKATSSQNGSSSVISFTTKTTNEAPVVYLPGNTATSISLTPTIYYYSKSTGNSSSSPDSIKVELSKSSSFSSSQGSPDYQISSWYLKTDNSTDSLNWSVATLNYNTTYYLKATSITNGSSTVTSFTTKQPDAPVLTLVDGIDASPDTVYANKRVTPLTATSVTGAEQYNWEFDIQGDFVSVEYSTSTTTNVLNLDATTLNSGQSYWVRVQAVSNSVPFQSDITASTPHKFFNALHPIELYAPTTTSSNANPKLWTPNVDSATVFIFQVDDNSDFSSPFVNTCARTWANTTWTGVTGNVFKANKNWYAVTGWTPSSNPITYRAFESPACLPDATYYVRVRAANSHQSGYWDNVKTFTVSGGGYKMAASGSLTDNSISDINIYPNPAQNEVTIEFNQIVAGTLVKIFSSTGELVKEININNQTTQIDVSDLQRGIYFIQNIYNDKATSTKIVLW